MQHSPRPRATRCRIRQDAELLGLAIQSCDFHIFVAFVPPGILDHHAWPKSFKAAGCGIKYWVDLYEDMAEKHIYLSRTACGETD